MSVNMMNYITDKTYHEDIYNQPKSNIDRVDRDISNYIDLNTIMDMNWELQILDIRH